ncbi:TetR/AcrR family transcriptional regulator [Nocardia sp. NPDC088792]|uniref:TetR/AcrR family transcriptional regulator n=1 Tax=Nocardia sp. NPDC088792 TaxID=3364332 RepID=UPI0038055ADB
MSSPTAKRPRQPRMLLEVRREQVLDATLRLLNQHGYAALTMEAVSKEVNLAKPRVYAAYPGLEPLLVALLDREEQRALTALADAMPAFEDSTGFDEILVTALTNLLQAVAANPETWRLLILPVGDAPAQIRERFETGRRFALSRLTDLLEWGRDRRRGLADLDLELTAISLLAMGEQAARLVISQPDRFTPERYRQFAQTLLSTMATPIDAG